MSLLVKLEVGTREDDTATFGVLKTPCLGFTVEYTSIKLVKISDAKTISIRNFCKCLSCLDDVRGYILWEILAS
jgi:hypothetical protein